MYDLLVRDPSRIRFMQTKEEDSLDALGITRLIKSPSQDTVNIGVNFCMFLVHHSEKLTLTNLIKFDMESRDIILKREN